MLPFPKRVFLRSHPSPNISIREVPHDSGIRKTARTRALLTQQKEKEREFETLEKDTLQQTEHQPG